MRKLKYLAFVLPLAFFATACGDDEAVEITPLVVDSTSVEELVATTVSPDRLTVVKTAEGEVELTIPAGAVDSAVELTIGLLAEDKIPAGVVGNVYILGPEGLEFLEPVRLRMKVAGDVANASALRPAHLDTEDGKFSVLDNWVYVADTQIIAGDLHHLSAYGATDGTGNPLVNDSTPSLTAEAYELLSQRQISASLAKYDEAVAADDTDLQAHFGAALTHAMLLLEHPAVDDVLAECSEIPFDAETLLYGPEGALAHEYNDRDGQVALALQRGATAEALTPADFDVKALYTNYDSWDDGTYTNEEIWMDFDTVRNAAGERLDMSLSFYIDQLSWQDGDEIAFDSENAYFSMWLDNDCNSDEEECEDTGSIRAVAGKIVVVSAPQGADEAISLRFDDLRFERTIYDYTNDVETLEEVLVLNGTVDDIAYGDFEPEAGTVPFDGLDYQEYEEGPPMIAEKDEFIQMLQQCGVGFNLPFLLGKADMMMEEVVVIRSHLEAISTADTVNDFMWNLPVGLFANAIEVPVGPVMIHGTVAALYTLEATNEIVQQYGFLNADLVDLIAIIDPWFDGGNTCEQICDAQGANCYEDCQPYASAVWDLDVDAVAADLNTNFLTHSAALDMTKDVRPALESALGFLKVALQAVPTQEVIFNFMANPLAQGFGSEVVSFADLLVASMDAEQAMTLTPEYKIHLKNFFDAPFDRASILSAAAIDAIFYVEPADLEYGENAWVEMHEDAAMEMLKSFMTLPAEPLTETFCILDTDCAETLVCNGWNDAVGVCSGDRTTSCASYEDCNSEALGYNCDKEICEPREPQPVDEAKVDAALEGEYPAFMDAVLMDYLDDNL